MHSSQALHRVYKCDPTYSVHKDGRVHDDASTDVETTGPVEPSSDADDTEGTGGGAASESFPSPSFWRGESSEAWAEVLSGPTVPPLTGGTAAPPPPSLWGGVGTGALAGVLSRGATVSPCPFSP